MQGVGRADVLLYFKCPTIKQMRCPVNTYENLKTALRYAKFFSQVNLAQSQFPVSPKAHQAACGNGTSAFTASEHLGGLKPQQGSYALYDPFKIVSSCF